ncbi:Uncharacterized protein DAT39_013200, partial [Clarias magur]
GEVQAVLAGHGLLTKLRQLQNSGPLINTGSCLHFLMCFMRLSHSLMGHLILGTLYLCLLNQGARECVRDEGKEKGNRASVEKDAVRLGIRRDIRTLEDGKSAVQGLL